MKMNRVFFFFFGGLGGGGGGGGVYRVVLLCQWLVCWYAGMLVC